MTNSPNGAGSAAGNDRERDEPKTDSHLEVLRRALEEIASAVPEQVASGFVQGPAVLWGWAQRRAREALAVGEGGNSSSSADGAAQGTDSLAAPEVQHFAGCTGKQPIKTYCLVCGAGFQAYHDWFSRKVKLEDGCEMGSAARLLDAKAVKP